MLGEKLRSLQHSRATLTEIERALNDKSKKIGELALLTLASILQHPDFPEDILERFRQVSYSKKVFGLSYPLLIRKREWTKASQYYANYLYCNGKYYCLSSAWFESHRARLVAWVRKHKIDINERRDEWILGSTISLSPHSRPSKQAWVFDFGKVYRKSHHLCMIELRIPKKLVEFLARQDMECIFQGMQEEKILLFRIDALTLDKEFWRDVKYYTKNQFDNRWRFYINVDNGDLYSRFGSLRMKFGRCSRQEANARLRVSSAFETLYEGNTQSAQPVAPVSASRAESLLAQQASSQGDKKTQKNKDKDIYRDLFGKSQQSKQQRSPLNIQFSNNEERQYIKIQDTDVSNKERLCRFVAKGSNTVWEISSKKLIIGLKAKRVSPIVFTGEGIFWTFYLDGQTGKIYKLLSDRNAILQLAGG